MPFTLVIDSSALCYSALHSTGALQYRSVNTGVIYGFLNQLGTLMRFFETKDLVFCWDSAESIRKRRYPWYKTRETSATTEEEKRQRALVHAQIPILRKKVLPTIGFRNSFIQDGYEADDIIAAIALNDIVEKPCIISSDKDMYQLLHKAPMYSTAGKKFYHKRTLMMDYGIEPQQWADVKAIAGCTSDTVPGVEGVGDKLAARYLNGTLSAGKKRADIVSSTGRALRDRNAWLVALPMEGTEVPSVVPDSFSHEGLMRICDEYGLKSILASAEWRALTKAKSRTGFV